MKKALLICVLVICGCEEKQQKLQLPSGFTMDQVKTQLDEVGAMMKDGKLCDRAGKPIYLHRGIQWGNPPQNYQEILAKERELLAAKEKQGYRVIIIRNNLIR